MMALCSRSNANEFVVRSKPVLAKFPDWEVHVLVGGKPRCTGNPYMKDRYGRIARSLNAWFEKNKRDLPFRRTKDPYQIWISEIMAQQTRIAALIPYFERFTRASFLR